MLKKLVLQERVVVGVSLAKFDMAYGHPSLTLAFFGVFCCNYKVVQFHNAPPIQRTYIGSLHPQLICS